MKRTWRCGAVAAALSLCSVSLPAQAPAAARKAWYAKLAEPFPDAARLGERRVASENRALFQSVEPLAITIAADFKKVNGDRAQDSPRRYPATLTVAGSPGAPLPVQLGTRGHFRLHPSSCSFVPLRVEFPAGAVGGTLFDGQRSLKLVTHCQDANAYEQYTLHEYLVYRMFNVMTPRSFRARLVKATYVDAKSQKPVASRYAIFLEDDDDVARRAEGRIVDVPNALFKDLDQGALTLMALFQYMIANTDFSIIRLHNVRLVQDRDRVLYTVPYDFDFSGLVNTRYSEPDKQLGIRSVRERLYRGPCRTEADLEPLLERFRARKSDLMAVYDSQADLSANGRRGAQRFLQEFYSVIERRDQVRKILVNGCTKTAGM